MQILLLDLYTILLEVYRRIDIESEEFPFDDQQLLWSRVSALYSYFCIATCSQTFFERGKELVLKDVSFTRDLNAVFHVSFGLMSLVIRISGSPW